ncbi:sulfotransferase domain-containing protein [Neptuniibacter sp. PT34_22]|uniref:sulfotransferase domain-containing protein n=1 Tax=Neptuniibacter sp. PT34_22 TaxID=3398205 RepID=UPI0039F5B5A8
MKSTKNTIIPVAIHGVPRSGTTWIGEIINSSPCSIYKYQPLFSYKHKGFLTPESSTDRINSFFELLTKCDDSFTGQTEQRLKGTLPRFKKKQISHIVYKEVRYHHILENLLQKTENLKLVLIIRNPLSVINSWLKAPREFRNDLGWLVEEEWQYADKKNLKKPEEFYGYERWKEATNLFLKLKAKSHDRVHIITYSQFLKSPKTETKKLFSFLDLSYSDQTELFLQDSTIKMNKDPYSVYKSDQSDNSWITELPSYIVEFIKSDLKGSELEKFLDN